MKKRIIGAFAFALIASMSISTFTTAFAAKYDGKIPTGFTVSQDDLVEIKGGNGALSDWNHYFNGANGPDGNPRGMVYEDENLALKATEDGHNGNAMHFERKSATGELVAFSYFMVPKQDQDYIVSAFVKGDVTNGKLEFEMQERLTGVSGDQNKKLGDVTAFGDGWNEVKFNYHSSANAENVRVKIASFGQGDIYVDDIQMRETNVPAPTNYFRGQSIGKMGDATAPATDHLDLENGVKNMKNISSANLSSDSSDGDGSSLMLNNMEVFKTNFSGIMKNDNLYKLSFKYKMAGDVGEKRIAIRMDYFSKDTSITEQQYWINIDPATATEWTEFSEEFYGVGGEGLKVLGICSYGNYLIDELSIVCLDSSDQVQYITNGSFSGAYTMGYQLGDNTNVSKQTDGNYAFVLMNGTLDDKCGYRGYLGINANLTAGEEYKISFDYFFQGAEWVDKMIIVNGTETKLTEVTKNWIKKEVTFTSNGNDDIKIYGPSYYLWTVMIKNISITDAEGNEYITNKTLVAPDQVIGENVFPYGTFEGNTEYTTDDWQFQGNAYGYGTTFDMTYEGGRYNPETGTGVYKQDWKLIFKSTEEVPAVAVSKEISVSAKTLYIFKEMYAGEVETSLLIGDQELKVEENGFFELPDGTTSVRIKFTGKGSYAALKYVFVMSHNHTVPTDENEFKTEEADCTKSGGKYYTCEGCEKKVYVTKVAKKDHELEHLHKDATCREGYDKYVCKNCKEEFDVTIIPATGKHVWKDEVISEADCAHSGTKQSVCEVCGSKGDLTIIPKTDDHEYVDGKCTVCGKEQPKDPDDSGDNPVDSGSGSGDKPADSGKSCESALSGGSIAIFASALLAAGYAIVRRKKED